MKKGTFIPILSALALLASCSQNDIVESTQSSNAISFGTSIGSTGRVASTTTESILNFKVFGVNTGDITWAEASNKSNNFMSGDVVSRTGLGEPWTYSPIKYWPETGNVTFYAYSPKDADITPTFTEGNPTFTYEVNTDPALQEDLLADIRVDQKKSAGQVSFAFNHLLSKIGFTAQLKEDLKDDATLSITNFTITYDDLVKGGTYTYANTDQGQGSWEATSTYTEGTLSTNFAETTPIEVTTTAGSLIGEDDLMLMPQEAPTFQVKIDYKVEYTDGMEVDESKTITLPAYANGWEAGKQYVYNFKLSPTEVVFDDVIVGGWEDKETIDWEENDIIITNDKGQRVNAFNADFDNTNEGEHIFTIKGAKKVELKSGLTHFGCTFDGAGVSVAASRSEEESKSLVFTPLAENKGEKITEEVDILITGTDDVQHTYHAKLTQAAGEISLSADEDLYFKASDGTFVDNISGAATSNVITVNGANEASVSISNEAFKCEANGNRFTFTKTGENSGTEAIKATATITAGGKTFTINLIQPAMPAFSDVVGNAITVKFGSTGIIYDSSSTYTLASDDITVNDNSANFATTAEGTTVTISAVKTLGKVVPVTENGTITLTNVCGDKKTYTVHFTQNGQAYISNSANGKEVTSVTLGAVFDNPQTLYVVNGTIENTQALNATDVTNGKATWKTATSFEIRRSGTAFNDFGGNLTVTITNVYNSSTTEASISCKPLL